MPKNIKRYDTAYKKLFTNKEIVASLLQGFVPEYILTDLDLPSLTSLPSEHITHDNNERRNDLLWKVRYGDNFCYLLIIIEFQSVEDWWMALRISSYSTLILQDVVKYQGLKKKDKLPLIFPFVIYNGNKKWQAPIEINKLFCEHNKFIDIFQIHQQFYLLDIKHIYKDIKDAKHNLAMQIFNFENANSIEHVIKTLSNLAKILPESEKVFLHEAFLNLLSINIINDKKLSKQILDCKTVQEAYAMLLEEEPLWKIKLMKKSEKTGFKKGEKSGFVKGEESGFVKGEKSGFVKGEESGFTKGLKNSILEILSARFGLLSKEIPDSIGKISNVDFLKSLILEATSIESLKLFSEKLQDKQD